MGSDIQDLGYLATPESGSGPGVIVLQEWWGLVPHIKDVADRFAAAGYVALAPDLYKGESTQSPDEAGRMMMALDIEQAAQDLAAAIEYLRHLEATVGDKVGVIGFCMGGQLALLAATVNAVSPAIAAVVDFYGIHPQVQPNFANLAAPILGIFGEQDHFVPVESVEHLVASVRSAGGQITTQVYPNVTHAFFNDTRPEVYNAEAATDAWQRTLAFLSTHLATV